MEFSAMGYLCRLTKMNWKTFHDVTEKNVLKNAVTGKGFSNQMKMHMFKSNTEIHYCLY